MSDNPNKKIRLDLHKKNDGSTGNEDLWGQDDLTAEEFDMLEIQATQSCNQGVSFGNHVLHNKNHNEQSTSMEVDDLKYLQYELEGRVKLLSHSLEKTTKELNEERLKREQLISERMKEYNKREINLQKEVERLQSILEFKDQEMKSIHSKLQMTKSQLKAKKSTNAEATTNNTFEDFLNSSKSASSNYFNKPNIPKNFQRKHKLVTDSPKGETKTIDILSSILFSRLSLPTFSSCEYAANSTGLEQDFSNSFGSAASIIKLKDEQKYSEILDYYICFLRNHVVMLKAIAGKSNVATCNKNSPISSKIREAGYSQTVISYLQDIAYIFSCSKSNLNTEEKCNLEKHSEQENVMKTEEQSSAHENVSHSSVSIISQTLQLLLELANPKTYPTGYSKNEEIELSLSVLLAICSSNPEKFLDLIGELPIYSFLNPLQNITAICITMNLLITLCSCKNFISFLTHRSNNCIFCLIASCLIKIVPYYPENFAISLILVENFLSLVFSTNTFLETLLETSECISEIIQGVIVSVWKYYQVREKISLSIEIIKKGFLLLHFMSYCIPNFKERRNPVENEYISLISNILSFSKENIELSELYDLIHTLWDFQTDITEFDSDDLPEETQNSTTGDMVVEI